MNTTSRPHHDSLQTNTEEEKEDGPCLTRPRCHRRAMQPVVRKKNRITAKRQSMSSSPLPLSSTRPLSVLHV